MSRVLVAGSYPPVPRVASATTLAAVRRLRNEDSHVEVVSPRPSAAHHSARLQGIGAAWWLTVLRRRTGADTLVLCLEPGVPFDPDSGPARRRLTAALLGLALRRFDNVSLVVADDLTDDAAAVAVLWPHAHEVVVITGEMRQLVVERAGVPAAMVRVETREPAPVRPAQQESYGTRPEDLPPQVAIRERADRLRHRFEAAASVTPFGPPEWAWHEQPRRVASVGFRLVLGRHADEVRARLVRVYRRARPAT